MYSCKLFEICDLNQQSYIEKMIDTERKFHSLFLNLDSCTNFYQFLFIFRTRNPMIHVWMPSWSFDLNLLIQWIAKIQDIKARFYRYMDFILVKLPDLIHQLVYHPDLSCFYIRLNGQNRPWGESDSHNTLFS